jgi:DNA-binding LytR/AlgR family response regulator
MAKYSELSETEFSPGPTRGHHPFYNTLRPVYAQVIQVVMIERERNSLKILEEHLSLLSNMQIIKKLNTVEEINEYFESATEKVDLIFTEVELKDGIVFDLIEILKLKVPVVYLANTSKYRDRALGFNALDFFLIPDQYSEMIAAFSLYSKMNLHLSQTPIFSIPGKYHKSPKERIIGKKGLESIILNIEEIAIIHTHNNLVFAITKDNQSYRVDKKLNQLEAELSVSGFFRISRQYLVNIKFIKGYKTYDRIKLVLSLKEIIWNTQLIVSQDHTPGFKKWIDSMLS